MKQILFERQGKETHTSNNSRMMLLEFMFRFIESKLTDSCLHDFVSLTTCKEKLLISIIIQKSPVVNLGENRVKSSMITSKPTLRSITTVNNVKQEYEYELDPAFLIDHAYKNNGLDVSQSQVRKKLVDLDEEEEVADEYVQTRSDRGVKANSSIGIVVDAGMVVDDDEDADWDSDIGLKEDVSVGEDLANSVNRVFVHDGI